MTWTLTLCIGVFLGICGSRQHYDYPTEAACLTALKIAEARPAVAFGVCAPKAKGATP